MKQYLYIIIALAAALFTSCSRDDDFDELFYGKTWYIVGAKVNGVVLKSEVTQFYNSGAGSYQIAFVNGNFTGALSAPCQFSGRWSADSKHRDMRLHITQPASPTSTFDTNLYHIIAACTRYDGDANVMRLIEDDNNYIDLNNFRPHK